MTQEEKDLLLKDLCARLPYGVKCQIKGEENLEPVVLKSFMNCEPIFAFDFYLKENSSLDFKELGEFKPYLFPMSSMTEEQKKYITDRWGINEDFDFEIDPNWGKYFIDLGDVVDYVNWLIANHFDFNNLIGQGLAIDCTNLNIY